MALQILNPQRSFGEELGTSISSGLNRLLENKLQQLHFSDALKQNNYSDAQIAILNQLPANQRLEALQSLSPAGRGQPLQQRQEIIPQQQRSTEADELRQRLQSLGQQPEQLTQQELMGEFNQNKLQQMGFEQQQGPSSDFQALLNEAARQGLNLTNEQKQKIGRKVQEIYADQGKRKALEQDVMSFLNQQQAQQQQANEKAPVLQEPLLAQSPFKKPLTGAERIAQENLELKKLSAKERREAEAFKLTKEERKEISDKAKGARQNLRDLERLEDLEKEGKLDTPGYLAFLERSGLNIPSLMEPGSQEYAKVTQTFLRDAKSYLGSRISNFELEQFLKTIPSLSMSPEGRKRVIANLKYVNRASVDYNDVMNDIINKNNGVPPLNLTAQIDSKISKRLDKLSEQFKKDLTKSVPKPQKNLTTALQAILGNAAGSLPGILKGAAKGAIGGAAIGSIVPGIGTGAGALGGAAFGALGGSAKDII